MSNPSAKVITIYSYSEQEPVGGLKRGPPIIMRLPRLAAVLIFLFVRVPFQPELDQPVN